MRISTVGFLLCFFLVGCGAGAPAKEEETSPSSKVSSSQPSSATALVTSSTGNSMGASAAATPASPIATIYQTNCAQCHGMQGEGTATGVSYRGLSPLQVSTGVARMPLGARLNCGAITASTCRSDLTTYIVANFTAQPTASSASSVVNPSSSPLSSTATSTANSLSSSRSSLVNTSLSSSRVSSSGIASSVSSSPVSSSSSRMSSSSSRMSSAASSSAASVDPVAIAAAYKNNCARCHGNSGEGLLGFPALNGTLSTDPYVTVNTMPKDGTALDCGTISPSTCRPALAAYIVANFVGKANIPVAITNPLRRLSKSEYTNTLSDLFPGVTLPPLSFGIEETVFGFFNNWERQAPSSMLIDALYHNADNLVNALTDTNLNNIIPCTTRDTACATSFIQQFGRRVYRHPVPTTEVNQILAAFYTGVSSDTAFKTATKLTLKYFLMNADFLYRPEFGSGGILTAYEKASRISFFIWQSMPDDTLLDAAQNGTLDSQSGLGQQVDRLLADARAERGVRQFFGSWLNVDKIDSIIKAPQYDITLAQKASLKESILQFVWLELFKKNLSLTQLLTSNTFYIDSNIASLFGVSAGSQLQAQTLSPSQRTGILTHPGILASYGHSTYPSPVLRGVFVMDKIMCTPPNPPPPNISTNPPAPATGTPLTNRELYLDATTYKGALCAACHNVINPLGFSMEMFDTRGVFRSTDNGFPLDTTGQALGFNFANVFDLTASIATSSAYRSCVTKKMLSFGTGGWNMVNDNTMRNNLIAASNGLLTRDLFKAIAMHPNFSQTFYPAQ